MSWNRKQYRKVLKPVRHARVNLCVVHCVDCGCQLQATHLVIRFGDRCRACWSAFSAGAAEMASR